MKKEKESRKKNLRISQRQNLKLHYAVAAGSIGLLTLLLILYFNLSKNEDMKAKEKENESVSTSGLPCDYEVEQPLIMTQQPEMRGFPYKSIKEEKDFINSPN